MKHHFMASLLSAIALLLAMPTIWAAEPEDEQKNIVENINNAKGSVYIAQPQSLDAITDYNTQQSSTTNSKSSNVGYRVQVFSDNNMTSAKKNAEYRKHAIEQAMSDTRVYITYESPYWRVRVGDYRSYAEADAAMREMKASFPSFSSDMRIVRERINAVQ